MESKISVLVPTRGRRSLAERFLLSAFQLSNAPNSVEYILYVDDDDLDSQAISVTGVQYRIIVGPRCNMGVCNTRCLEEAQGDIIVLGNDDVVIRTKGWDEKIRIFHQSIPDRIYLAYPNDLNKGEELSAFPILSRKTCELISQPFPAIYKGAFIDTHLMEIFVRLKNMGDNRISYMEDVVFEHLHFRTGKVEIDQTYKDRDRFADDMIFLSLNHIRKDTAKFLSNVINNKISDASRFNFTEPSIIKRPASLLRMIRVLASLYFFDRSLPLLFRIKDFLYYTVRWFFACMKRYR